MKLQESQYSPVEVAGPPLSTRRRQALGGGGAGGVGVIGGGVRRSAGMHKSPDPITIEMTLPEGRDPY